MAYKQDDIKALEAQIAQELTLIREIDQKARAEQRKMTPEEDAQWNTGSKKINDLEDQRDRMISENEREAKLSEIDSRAAKRADKPILTHKIGIGKDDATRPNETPEYRDMFFKALRSGRVRMENPIPIMEYQPGSGQAGSHGEYRTTMQVDVDIYGGYLVPPASMIDGILMAADEENALGGLVTDFPSEYGQTLGKLYLTGDTSVMSFAGELTSAESKNLQFGKRELKGHPFLRQEFKISRALVNSSAINLEAFVTQRVGVMLGETKEYYSMIGTGANQPLGLFTASDDGITTSQDVSTGNETTQPTFDGLINAQGALKQAYDNVSTWIFHRDCVTKIRKLKDGEGRYIWTMGNVVAGIPNRILDRPYRTSQYCPHTFTASNYVGIIGDFRYYYTTTVRTMAVQRLVELYALTGEIALLFDGMAFDGMPVLAEAFRRVKLAP